MTSTVRLRQRLRYEPATGWLIWLARPVADCANKRAANTWNTRFANKRAGTVRADGRRLLLIDGRLYLAARVIWQIVTGVVPPHDVDHKNLNSSDDRWDNLRLATRQQNMGNTKVRSNSTVGFKGVSKQRSGRCQARIGAGSARRCLGTFDTPEEAHAAYMVAAREAYGEFARAE